MLAADPQYLILNLNNDLGYNPWISTSSEIHLPGIGLDIISFQHLYIMVTSCDMAQRASEISALLLFDDRANIVSAFGTCDWAVWLYGSVCMIDGRFSGL